MAVNGEDLVVGNVYWHCDNTVLRKLVFLEKVEGRKQYRFAEGNKKRKVLMSTINLYWTYDNYREACLTMATILERYVPQYRRYAETLDGINGIYENGRLGYKRIKPRFI